MSTRYGDSPVATFEEWMRRVDAEIGVRCGLAHSDLSDWGYRDAYDSEVSPEEAAVEVLEQEGFPFA